MGFAAINIQEPEKISERLSGAIAGAISSLVVWICALGTVVIVFERSWQLWTQSLSEATILSFYFFSERLPFMALNYVGKQGALFAAAEGIVVLLGLAMSLAAQDRPRQLGLLILLGWFGLILASTGMAASESTDSALGVLALGLALIFGFVIHRTTRLWRSPD